MAAEVKKKKTPAKKKPAAKKVTSKKKLVAKKPVAKKKATKKKPIKASKPSKRTGTAKKKIKFTDVKDLINQGVEQFSAVHKELTTKLDKIGKLISDIRKLIADKGGDPAILDKAVASMNSLERLRIKMDSYMNTINSEHSTIEQKVAILENMQALSDIVSNVKVGE